MSALVAGIEGIGFWTTGLPGWASARDFVRDGHLPDSAPTRPSPRLLAPNERRRAPGTVAVALEVALAACDAAGYDPASLPSVFASTHGELAITDYMCTTLADQPHTLSPTRFHNSVHNAAAGYWSIGTGATAATTAISAFDASFAQGLLEALVQLATGTPTVLLVGYDGASAGPLADVSTSTGLLGGALLLTAQPGTGAMTLRATLADGDASQPDGPLARHDGGNAMAPMLGLFDALATGAGRVALHAGPGRILDVALTGATETLDEEPRHD